MVLSDSEISLCDPIKEQDLAYIGSAGELDTQEAFQDELK